MATKKNTPADAPDIIVNDPTEETSLDDPGTGRVDNSTTPAQERVNEQIAELREAGEEDAAAEGSLPGDAVLEPIPPSPIEEDPPSAEFEVVPLDPLDSEEAWKEKNRVPSGEAQQPTRYGTVHQPQSADQRAAIYADAGGQAVTRNPDGTLTRGIGPNAVIIEPADAPPPVNPLSTQSEQQRRVLYEDLINSEAEAFAADARRQFLNARLGGHDIEITVTERERSTEELLGDQDDPRDENTHEDLEYTESPIPEVEPGSEDRDPNEEAGIVPKS